MADLISAAQAKQMLQCDDATLKNHINSGRIRAQRVNGRLMLSAEDVQNLLAASQPDSDDMMILSGDSSDEDLQIDLGSVVDDQAQTIVQGRDDTEGTESITFDGEGDLEVVSFDDGNTEDLSFDDEGGTEDLSFTGGNTAVMDTEIEETEVGITSEGTGVGEVEWDDEDDEEDDDDYAPRRGRSSRLEARRLPPPRISPAWPVLAFLTLILCLFVAAPYYLIAWWPDETGGIYEYNGMPRRGVEDHAYVDMASSVAGFTIEPNEARWAESHQGEEYMPINQRPDGSPPVDDLGGRWRYLQYLGDEAPEGNETFEEALEARLRYFVIDVFNESQDNDGNTFITSASAIEASGMNETTGSVLHTYPVDIVPNPLEGVTSADDITVRVWE